MDMDIDIDFDFDDIDLDEFSEPTVIETHTFEEFPGTLVKAPSPEENIIPEDFKSVYESDTIFNDISMYTLISENYNLDLLSIFNQLELNEETFAMFLYSKSLVYPIVKLYKGYLTNDNISQLGFYMRSNKSVSISKEYNDTIVSYIQGESQQKSNSTLLKNKSSSYDKLNLRIKIKSSELNDKILNRNDLVLMVSITHTGHIKIQGHIKNMYEITIDSIKDIIIKKINEIINSIDTLKPFALPKEAIIYSKEYKQLAKTMTPMNPDLLSDYIQFADIQINAKTTKNVLGKLFVALKLGKLDSVRSIIKPNTKTVIFSIPFTAEETMDIRRRDIIIKKISRSFYNNKSKEFLNDTYYNLLKDWAIQWCNSVGYSNYIGYIESIYNKNKVKLAMQQKTQENQQMIFDKARINIIRAFGHSVRVHINKIIIYGIINLNELFISQYKIQKIFDKLKTMRIDVDEKELMSIDYTSEMLDSISENILDFTDDMNFMDAMSTIEELSLDSVDYEQEIKNNLFDTMNSKDSYTLFSLLKATNESFNDTTIKYGKLCQYNKPMFLLKSEFSDLINSIKNKSDNFSNYIRNVLAGSITIDPNDTVHYICAYVFDSETHEILNPYKFISRGDKGYYIPDLNTSESTMFPQGEMIKKKQMIPKTKDYPGVLTDYVYIENDKEYAVTMLNKPRYIFWKQIKSKTPEAPTCRVKPDIQLPCCITRNSDDIENNSGIYIGRNEFEYIYDSQKEENVNKPFKLPLELHLLLNNSSTYRETSYKYLRFTGYRGSYIHCFDQLLTQNYLELTQEELEDLWKKQFDSLTDNDFYELKTGLISVAFETKENYINYCKENLCELNEVLLLETIPKILGINFWTFIIQRKILGVNETYSIVYPQGYDIRRLYNNLTNPPEFACLIYKYTNSKNQEIYERVEQAIEWNKNVLDTTMKLNYQKQFFEDIITEIKNNTFDFDRKSLKNIPNGYEYIEGINVAIIDKSITNASIAPEFVTVNSLGYISGIILRNSIGIPVKPTTLYNYYKELPVVNNLPIKSKNDIDTLIKEIANSIPKELQKESELYYFIANAYSQIKGYIYSQDNKYIIGYMLNDNIPWYFSPELNNLAIQLPTDIKVLTQMYNVYDPFETNADQVFKDSGSYEMTYNYNKTVFESIVHAIEYVLSQKLSVTQRKELNELLKMYDSSQENKAIAQRIQEFIVNFLNDYIIVENTPDYTGLTPGSVFPNCLSNSKSKCESQCICKYVNGTCKLKGSNEYFETSIHYILEKMLNSFDTERYKILYSTIKNIKTDNLINDYNTESTLLIAEDNFEDAMNTLILACSNKSLNESKVNLGLLYGLTHINNLTDNLISVTINTLTSKISDLSESHELNINKSFQLYYYNTNDDSEESIVLNILQQKLNQNKLTFSNFKKELTLILKKLEIIQGPKGNQDYSKALVRFTNDYSDIKINNFNDALSIYSSVYHWGFNYIDLLLLSLCKYSKQPLLWLIEEYFDSLTIQKFYANPNYLPPDINSPTKKNVTLEIDYKEPEKDTNVIFIHNNTTDNFSIIYKIETPITPELTDDITPNEIFTDDEMLEIVKSIGYKSLSDVPNFFIDNSVVGGIFIK